MRIFKASGIQIVVEQLEAAIEARQWDSVIDQCSGSNHIVVIGIWSAAMNAQYSGIFLHQSRLKADGTPNDVALTSPRVRESMELGAQKCRDLLHHIIRESEEVKDINIDEEERRDFAARMAEAGVSL